MVRTLLAISMLATTTVRAEAVIEPAAPPADHGLADDGWKWPVGLAIAGSGIGAVAGVSASTVWVASTIPDCRNREDCFNIFQPWVWTIIYGIPAAILGAGTGSLAGMLVGLSIDSTGEDPATETTVKTTGL